MHSIGQCVVATVESVFPFGVFVRLDDTTRAYIRRRELTVSGDIDPRAAVTVGAQIEAEVISLAGPGHFLELSARARLPDPWPEFCLKHPVHSVVTATVKNLSPEGVFAQIIPGVDGFIPLRELAAWDLAGSEDLVWIGDMLEAVLTHVDPAGRRIRLSVKQRLEQLNRAQVYLNGLHASEASDGSPDEASTEDETQENIEPIGPTEEKKDRVAPGFSVLVLEDHQEVREPLVRWLEGLGCRTDSADRATDALELCARNTYHLLLVDLDLPHMNGISFIHRLRDSGQTSVPVAVISDPEVVGAHSPELQSLKIAQIFPKPLDLEEVQSFLMLISYDDRATFSVSLDHYSLAGIEEIQPFQSIAGEMRLGGDLEERFQMGLERLVQETRAEEAILFHFDHESQSVTIAASAGELPVKWEAAYALVSSPVKDVIEADRPIWEKQANLEHNARFRKLLDLLVFESCIGVPIQVMGQAEYALFIFHREPDAFSRYRLRDTLAMATFFAAALEGQNLNEHVKSLSGIFLSGQLAAGFGHEVYNKLSGLDLQFRNVRTDFARLEREHPTFQDMVDFREAVRTLDKAIEIAVGLRQTVAEFRGLMEIRPEREVDIPTVLRMAEVQVRPLARRAHCEVRIEPDPNLPSVKGYETGLLQVFLNLMINAIQHMDQSPTNSRLLKIKVSHPARTGQKCLEIRFTDTGPGIHRQLWEKIFALGFTTRQGGSGLGLFIARSLVESMGGTLQVEDSRVPFGTTFMVGLPLDAA